MSRRYLYKSIPVGMRLFMSLMLLFVYSLASAEDTTVNSGEPSIVSAISANHEESTHKVALLFDGKDDTYFYSGQSNGWTEAAYLEIDVKLDMLMENDSENCLVVTVKRHKSGLDDAHPTAFRVEGKFEGLDEWVPLFYTYFLYRGSLTQEFSERIPVANLWKDVHVSENNVVADADARRTGKAIEKMRFTVLSTNNNRKQEASGGNSYHAMALNAFDVMMLPVSSQLPGGFSNRFHLSTDYLTDLKDFSFENTKGILDLHNAVDGWWIERTDVDELLAAGDGIDISMPEYDLIESGTSAYPLNPDQKRQSTHTVEHILYAIPGDVVNLYPYYELYKTPKFQINYSHWYDYKTGGRLSYSPDWSSSSYDLLDFLTDPSNIQVTDDYGFFGGPHLNVKTYVVNTADDWIKLTAEMNATKTATQLKDEPLCYYIELGADLDFTGKENVEMMGNTTSRPFSYHLNGKGHTIKNLKINRPSDGDVGLIRYAADGAIIENLILDSSCSITGSYNVGGIVGTHKGGALTFRNVHTEATVIGTRKGSEQTAAGLLGFCNSIPNKDSNVLCIENCYIGGKIGDPDTNHGGSYNAALIAWWEVNGNEAPVVLKNVIVDCDLTGYESSNKFKRYIRHRHNTYAIVESGNVKTKSIFSFENCYGNVDQDDECWNPVDIRLQAFMSAEWVDVETPPMNDNLEIDADEFPENRRFYAGSADDYKKAVEKINQLTGNDIYFELTDNIDFGSRTDIPMLGQESSKPFSGFFNGNGHVISSLVQKKDYACVGIVRYAGAGIRIENLILDSTCHFEGTQYVALVGEHLGGKMTVCNYKTEATFIGTSTSAEQCAAAILGINKEKNTINEIHISDVFVGGSIGNQEKWPSNPNNAALIGWFENESYASQPISKISRVIVRCKLYHTDASKKKFIRHRQSDKSITVNGITGSYEKANFIFTDCFGSPDIDTNDGCWMQLSNRVHLCEYPTLEGWNDNTTPGIVVSSNLEKLQNNIGERAPGTSATFLYPWCPYLEKTEQTELTFPNGDDEYVIAADFSQRFDIGKNMDKENKVLYEPVISVRHIFRIRDGKTFADEISGSEESNRNYLRKNLKIVSARGGVPFQIRLTTPVPTEKNKNGRSNYYYKLEEGRYAHICGMDIRVLDGETRSVIENPGFNFAEEFTGLGTREINGVTYATGDGDNKYYRMLSLANPGANTHYVVQLIGKDDAGNIASIFDSTEPLVVMEYDITFLPERGASMLTEEKLYSDNNFKHARIEYLDETYGGTNRQPSTFIDFDDYIRINNLENDNLKGKFVQTASTTANGMQHSYFKWPLDWSLSEYSFGYNDRQDYNMYMLATHSSVVPYKDAAGAFNKNLEGDGTGLYDRLYYRTKRMNETGTYALQKMQQGYFYYVNASTDPGVTARLNINQLCQGSTIHVSAWIAEFSKADETANISFNFVAVLKDNIETDHPELGLGNGDRIVLHQFITGYVPKDMAGQWLNVYYSFVPRLSDFASETLNSNMVDHYEIELDNNCKNSAGADYAIDDIRAYVVPPTINAKQLAPMCSDKQLRIRVASPFDTLLELAGETEVPTGEAAKTVSLYYTFVDKEEFDSRMFEADDKNTEYPRILQETLVRPMPDRDYNHIQFWSNYSRNTPYTYTDNYVATDYAYRLRDQDTGERYIVFENLIDQSVNAGLLASGKEYYLVLNTGYGDFTPEKSLSDFFNLLDECASKCVMVITPSSVVKVNGLVETRKDRLVICENTSPVIQANVVGYNQTGDAIDIKKNAVFDWFFGSIEEFKGYKDSEGRTLEEALQVFRSKHPDALDLDGISADAVRTRGVEPLEQWMLDIIICAMNDVGDRGVPLLTLHQRTFVMPPVNMPDDEEVKILFTAIPIPIADEDIPENVVVCSDPTELSVVVGFKAPAMRHGLSGISYPDALTDVPLRIGLEQIREEKEGKFNMKTIEVPVYMAKSTDSNVDELVRSKEKRREGETEVEKYGCIILLQSDDPDYSDLGSPTDDSDTTDDFPWVGEVTKLQASTAEGAQNYFRMQLRDDFDVKEGYFYKLRFEYMENLVDEDKSDAICNGQELITLKIVPKYLVWDGSENLNWNNDANWSRVEAAELYSDKAAGEHSHFVSDGRNPRVKSYAPLDFTFVVVKDGVEAPYLYAPSETKSVSDGYETYSWPSSTIPKSSAATDYADYPAGSPGEATEWIQYDMAAKTLAEPVENVDVCCRPWYMNACREIHFKPGGTIMNQQELSYRKAWVDVELDHSRWQTLSTPLKEVYSGDFYLPSDDARQKTELFTDITFDNSLKLNHRFKPAVYQRGWDKGLAKVYELDRQSFDAPRNVAVKTSWSHVYNDVTEEYGGGNGFSIRTEVAAMDNAPVGKVLFRLPKADSEYRYFSMEGAEGHHTSVARTEWRYHRLNDTEGVITASSAETGSYFLVGNPFMTHMDIRGFIGQNSDVLEPSFWIVTSSGQIAGTIDGEVATVADPSEDADTYDPTVVAPMQGFFVKTKVPASSVNLKYNASMMRRYDSREGKDGRYLTSVTRSGESSGVVRIVAECDGIPSSAALLSTDTVRHSMTEIEAIDNRELDIPSIVYTVKDGRALSINFCGDAEGTEIGVIADDDTETLLRFSGVDAAEGLCLLDKADRSLTPLEEGMKLRVKGAAAGRYFLTYGISDEGMLSGIEWSVDGGVLTAIDNAASGFLEVNVYDTVGRLIDHASTAGATLDVALSSGIYVVAIRTAKETLSVKIRI